MAADQISAFSPVKASPAPIKAAISTRLGPTNRLFAMGVCILLLGCAELVRGADPYAAALDKRFETATNSSRGTDPRVKALEDGLRDQVREMSHRPEPAPPVNVNEASVWFVLVGVMLAGLSLGLFALVALRRWNQWLDREAAKRLDAITEDPLMAQFLQAPHGDLQVSAVQSQHVETGLSEEVPSKQDGESLPAPDGVQQMAVELAEDVAILRKNFQKLSRASDDTERQKILSKVLDLVELIKKGSDSAHLRSVRLLAFGLHGLLNQLSLKAANITTSSSRTAAAAIDLLELLCTRPSRPDLITSPPVRLLAVDDDAISRRAVSLSLKKAFNDPDLAPDGRIALALAEHNAYDVIFLDIEMPGMDGFELCSKIRKTAPNCTTPIVFVTSHSDFDSRAKSALSGANDLIGKPFLAFEITVKALSLVLRTRHAQEEKCARNEIAPDALQASRGLSWPPGSGPTVPVLALGLSQRIPSMLQAEEKSPVEGGRAIGR